MTADDIAYAELCVGCIDEKRCHDNVDCCERYMERVEELKVILSDVRMPPPELVEAMKGKDLWIGNEAFAKCMEGE